MSKMKVIKEQADSVWERLQQALGRTLNATPEQNSQRVQELFDKIKSLTPNQTFIHNNIDYFASLDVFKKLFTTDKNLKYIFGKLRQLERERNIDYQIPDFETVFILYYKLLVETALDDYAGVYIDMDSNRQFKFKVENLALFFVGLFVNQELTRDSTNTELFYNEDKSNIFQFTKDDNGKVDGGIFKIKSEGLTTTYQVAKIPGGSTSSINRDIFACINQYYSDGGYVMPSYSTDKSELYFDILKKYTDPATKKDMDTQLMFRKDYKAFWRLADRPEKILATGTWKCGDDGASYQITWSDGTIFRRPETETGQQQNQQQQQTQQQNQQQQAESCTATINCPKIDDVKTGKARYKKCMKCPEIQEIQEIPAFQAYLFPKLRDANLPQKVNDIFSPQMEEAIKEMQGQFAGLERSGQIGNRTYEILTSLKNAKPATQTQDAKKPTANVPKQNIYKVASEDMDF